MLTWKEFLNMVWSLDKKEQLKVIILQWKWWSLGTKLMKVGGCKVQPYNRNSELGVVFLY